MKVVILAGGYGTRLSEYTDRIPKPLVEIGQIPMITHIMNWYAKFGHTEFILALGYKGVVVKEYFLRHLQTLNDIEMDLSTGDIRHLGNDAPNWTIKLIDTGLDTMTGGRIKRLKEHINGERFFLTYGDGVADVNLDELVSAHNENKTLVTLTTVRPQARFGELILDGKNVVSFKEKPQTSTGWINGGYFVMEPEFIDLIKDDDTVLEKEPLEYAANAGQLSAFKHHGFWQCMDTKRDRDYLEEIWKDPKCPWR